MREMFTETRNRLCSPLLFFSLASVFVSFLYLMDHSKYIALSTQSVGVGPGMSHAPDQPLHPEPNHSPSSLILKQAGSTSMLA